jgi:hypothetical protein
LGDELVGGLDAEEDSERVKPSIDDVEKEQGDVPAVVKVTEEKPKDKAKGVQGK